MRARGIFWLAAFALGCEGETITPPFVVASPCAAGEIEVDGACEPAGLPLDMPCPPGQMPLDEGCLPAGVPPERCPEGYLAAGGGCDPVLPPAPCPDGLTALPGETTCRPLASCGEGPYGGIPVEADTVYVDASHTGNQSGSLDEPFTSIQAAIDAAPSGAIVAVAAGSYAEHVVITGKKVRLWGVCPELVEVVGPAEGVGAIELVSASDGSEVHTLSVTGFYAGLGMTDSIDVLLDRLWVHDTGDVGVVVENAFGPMSVHIQDSLVEGASIYGIIVVGAIATIERTTVREMELGNTGYAGHGIETHPGQGVGGQLTLTDVVVDGGRESGVTVAASTARLERVLVRDTSGHGHGKRGHGLAFFDIPMYPPAHVEVVDTVVLRSQDAGMVVGASLVEVDGLTVRDVVARPDGGGGSGIFVEGWEYVAERARLELRHALVEGSHGHGVFVTSSDVVLEGLLVRDVGVDPTGRFGRGIGIQADPETSHRSAAIVRHSVVETVRDAGIFVHGSDLTLEASHVHDVTVADVGFHATSLTAISDLTTGQRSAVTVRASLFERSALAGVQVSSSDLVLERSVIRDTSPSHQGFFGDGVFVIADFGEARFDLIGSRIENSARAGVACFGASASLEHAALACQAFDLDAEPWKNLGCVFEDRGGNACGCGELGPGCKSVSAELAPPPSTPPFENP